jgi:hypothetical protein
MGLLIEKKPKHEHQVLTEEKLDDIGSRLDHTPRKSLKHLAQVTGVSESSERWTTQLLKCRPYKTTLFYTLQLHDSASRVHFCRWFLQSIIKGGINLQFAFFSDEAWVHLQGYINMQSNHYWSSQNPHLTHEVLHSVKVGVWYAESARRIVGLVFFNRIISCFQFNRRRKTLWLVSVRLSYCPHCMYVCAGFVHCLREQ